MSAASQSATAIEPQAVRQAALSPTRPFYWSVRRELWEYRSIYLAPLIVAGLVLFGFVISITHLPADVRGIASAPSIQQFLVVAMPFVIATAAIGGAGMIVGFFYCLGALYNERRDRSILFWKSLPVSNVTTVLSKSFVPLVILPLVIFAVTVVTVLIMLGLGSAALSVSGVNPAFLWDRWPVLRMTIVLGYMIVVATLWYAPIWGWLLLVSSWARSMAILWAVLPPLGLGLVELIAFHTHRVFGLIGYRLHGYEEEALYYRKGMALTDPLAFLTPAHFLSSPGLWSGLVVAAIFLAAAIWLRRGREPI